MAITYFPKRPAKILAGPTKRVRLRFTDCSRWNFSNIKIERIYAILKHRTFKVECRRLYFESLRSMIGIHENLSLNDNFRALFKKTRTAYCNSRHYRKRHGFFGRNGGEHRRAHHSK